jgi:hypothetical protein
MAAVKNHKYVYYRCTPSRDAGCKPGLVVSESGLIEATRFFISRVSELPGLIEAAQQAYTNVQREQAAPTEDERHRLEKELAELERRKGAAIQAQIGAIARGGDSDAYTDAVVQLEIQVRPLRARLELISRPKSGGSASRSFVEVLERLPLLSERLLTDTQIPASERGKALALLFDGLVPTQGGVIFEVKKNESVLRVKTHGTDSLSVEVAEA